MAQEMLSSRLLSVIGKIKATIIEIGEMTPEGYKVEQSVFYNYLKSDIEYVKGRRGYGKTKQIIEKYLADEFVIRDEGKKTWVYWLRSDKSGNTCAENATHKQSIQSTSDKNEQFRKEIESFIAEKGELTPDGYRVNFSLLCGKLLNANPEIRKQLGKTRTTMLNRLANEFGIPVEEKEQWVYWVDSSKSKNISKANGEIRPSAQHLESGKTEQLGKEIEAFIIENGELTSEGYRINFSSLCGKLLNTKPAFQEMRKKYGKTRETVLNELNDCLCLRVVGTTEWAYLTSQGRDDKRLMKTEKESIDYGLQADYLQGLIILNGNKTPEGYRINLSSLGAILKTKATFQELANGSLDQIKENLLRFYRKNITFEKKKGSKDEWLYWSTTTSNSASNDVGNETHQTKEPIGSENVELHDKAQNGAFNELSKEKPESIIDSISIEQAIQLFDLLKKFSPAWSSGEAEILNSLTQNRIIIADYTSLIEKLTLLQHLTSEKLFKDIKIKRIIEAVPVDMLLVMLKSKVDDYCFAEIAGLVKLMLDDVCSALRETMPFVLELPEIVKLYDVINRAAMENNEKNLIVLHDCYKKIRTVSMWLNAGYNWSITNSDEEVFRSFGLTTSFMYNGIQNYWHDNDTNLISYLEHEKKYQEFHNLRNSFDAINDHASKSGEDINELDSDHSKQILDKEDSKPKAAEVIEEAVLKSNDKDLNAKMDGNPGYETVDSITTQNGIKQDDIDVLEDLLAY